MDCGELQDQDTAAGGTSMIKVSGPLRLECQMPCLDFKRASGLSKLRLIWQQHSKLHQLRPLSMQCIVPLPLHCTANQHCTFMSLCKSCQH